KAKAGRLKLLKVLLQNNCSCVLMNKMIGPAIIGSYSDINFIILVRHWSDCSKYFRTMRFNKFLDIVDDLYLGLIKIYFCTLEENEINTTDIEIYNSKFENPKLFYFKDHVLLLNKLKELSSFEQISSTMKYYDLPIRKRKTDNFIKFFEKEIGFNYLYPI
ncbi:1820_t:CDS:1, partial [Cetraspora pellucida]